jgi:hypothetical protein
MNTLLFRLVHYLPTAHLALAVFSALAALWVVGASLTETPPPGLDTLQRAGTVCRWLAVIYLALGAALQFQLSRSGHSILAQPSRLWVLYVANQTLLLVLLLGVVARATQSRVHLMGLHHGVAALLIVSALSVVLAAVDRMAAAGLASTIPGWDDDNTVRHTVGLSLAFVVTAALLFLAIGYLEAQPLPHMTAAPPITEAESSKRQPHQHGVARYSERRYLRRGRPPRPNGGGLVGAVPATSGSAPPTGSILGTSV